MANTISKKIKTRLRGMVRDMLTDGDQSWADRYENSDEVGFCDLHRIIAYLQALCDTGVITQEKTNLLTEAASKLQASCGWDAECEYEAERKKHLLQLIRGM